MAQKVVLWSHTAARKGKRLGGLAPDVSGVLWLLEKGEGCWLPVTGLPQMLGDKSSSVIGLLGYSVRLDT